MPKQIISIIVDDEIAARDSLENLVNKHFSYITVFAKHDNAKDALNTIMEKDIDIIFLDIDMPKNDGFWLADKIHKIRKNTCIIFITAFNKFAVDAIKHAPFDFLHKPVGQDMLIKSIDRYLENRDRYDLNKKLENLKEYLKQEKLKFNTNLGFAMIAPENIVYCEADRNYSNLYLSNGRKEMITSQLGLIEEKLAHKSFVRISRSILINLDYLESFQRKSKTVVLNTVMQNHELSVSLSGVRKLQNSLST